ncbi:MAG: SAM-dependent methyltransferase, partial [Actinomycetes bacterium]
CTDVFEWEPERQWNVWHERAMFHFVNSDDDIARYLEVMAQAIAPGGFAIIGTFNVEGPLTCSGLPVAHYTADELGTLFAPHFHLIAASSEQHLTPSGDSQPYTWVVLRRRPNS